MSSWLRRRLKSFQSARNRRLFTEEVYEEMLKYSFIPFDTAKALDTLLEKLANDCLEKPVIVVQGDHDRILKPYFKAPRTDQFKYEIRMFGKHFTIAVFDKESVIDENMKLRVRVRNGYKLLFNWAVDMNPDSSEEDLGYEMGDGRRSEYCHLENLFSRWEPHFQGVAVKIPEEHGKFSFAGRYINLGADQGEKPTIVFFDKGDLYYFDLDGNMVFETLSSIEVIQQRKLERIISIETEKEKIDLNIFGSEVMEDLKKKWYDEPSIGNRLGRTVILRTSIEGKVMPNGYVNFTHIANGHKSTGFYVHTDFHKETVRTEFKGPFALFYRQDKLVNAFRIEEGISCEKPLRSEKPTDAVIIRNVDNPHLYKVTSNRVVYHFSKVLLSNRAGDLSQYDHKAIVGHVNQEDQQFRFELLSKKGDECAAFPIEHYKTELQGK
ncbi:MAG: hypothetical protein QF915_04460 [Candidatus Woesearchaeota archaeon]|nr:hypothetical protein [Candidatus Woesearchaeota archaeon]MDP7458582.1 hypothetical protein [Candidatus Woesearchaeota archaeon]